MWGKSNEQGYTHTSGPRLVLRVAQEVHAQAHMRKMLKCLQVGSLLPIASIYILLQGNLPDLLKPHPIVLPQHIIDEGPVVFLSNLDVGRAVEKAESEDEKSGEESEDDEQPPA
jgi:hypothetical protein